MEILIDIGKWAVIIVVGYALFWWTYHQVHK